MPTNNKQQAFVDEYVKDWNATQAAIRAGYSEKTAKAQGARLLTKADVQAAIAEKHAAIAERNDLESDEVVAGLRRVVKIALCDEAVEEQLMSGKRGQVKSANLQAAVAALDRLGRIAGAFDDKTHIDGELRITWDE